MLNMVTGTIKRPREDEESSKYEKWGMIGAINFTQLINYWIRLGMVLGWSLINYKVEIRLKENKENSGNWIWNEF